MPVLLLVLAQHGLADTWYVRAGAGGSNDGTDWDNAFPEMDQIDWGGIGPGDVVEIAGGAYVTTLSVSASGAQGQPVVVRRTTDPAHDSLVDMFTVHFGSARYVTLDGAVANGIRITSRGQADVHLITDSGASDITIRNVEIEGTGYIECDSSRGMNIRADNLLVDSVFIHDFSAVGIRLIGNDTVTITNSVLHNILSKGDAVCQAEVGHNVHFEHIAVFDGVRDITIKNCVFSQQYDGTPSAVAGGFGVSMALNSGHVRYYNNVFFNVRSPFYVNSDGMGAVTEYIVSGNTFVGYRTPIGGSPDQAKNNVFCNLDSYFNSSSTRWAYTGGSHNLYCHDGRYVADYRAAPDSQVLDQDEHPFIDYLTDRHLVRATNPGETLPAPYDVDAEGDPRGGDGNWDRGAFEYVSGGDQVSPGPPLNLRAE